MRGARLFLALVTFTGQPSWAQFRSATSGAGTSAAPSVVAIGAGTSVTTLPSVTAPLGTPLQFSPSVSIGGPASLALPPLFSAPASARGASRPALTAAPAPLAALPALARSGTWAPAAAAEPALDGRFSSRVAAPLDFAASALRLWSGRAAEDAPAPEPLRLEARSGFEDSATYARITASSLWWYTGPRLFERWDEMKESLRSRAGRPRAVHNVQAFFVAHRVLGSTGSYGPMGWRPAANRIVVNDVRSLYRRYFRRDQAADDAFERLIARAERFNPQRRSTQFRKVLFHALREAAVLEPQEVAPYLDSLLGPERAKELADYQRDVQPHVLVAFQKAVEETILEVNQGAPVGHRVLGALLLGSFANGAAGPGSDLDVQAVTEGGSTLLNDRFIKSLKDRWKASGFAGSPVSGFQYAVPPSKPLLTRMHPEPYRIFTPYPEVLKLLDRSSEEEHHDAPTGLRTLRGWFYQTSYGMLLRVILAAYDIAVRK